MIVQAVQATVYRAASGRRYFTRAAAYRHAAKARIKAAYPCDCTYDDHGGALFNGEFFACERHANEERFKKLTARLARFLRFVDERRTAKATEKA